VPGTEDSQPVARPQVAAAYERIIDRVRAWAEGEDGVRAAVVIGSRARRDHPADEWSDLDLLVVVEDDAGYAEESGWTSTIGEPWFSFVQPTPDGRGRERRVLFAGGLDVDFAFIRAGEAAASLTADPAAAAVVLGRGMRVLVDKDGFVARAGVSGPPMPPPPPDQAAIDNLCADFWYHVVWTAKHLRRGEVWWAKGCCDGHLKGLLAQMLEWNATAMGRDPWFRGRFLEEWADPAAVAGLRAAFAHYDLDDTWRALAATMDVFGDLARRTAAVLGLDHRPEIEDHARRLLTQIRDATEPVRP
jgi:aminoglycoside 6-adenylyltransferase